MWLFCKLRKSSQDLLVSSLILSAVIVTIEASVTKTRPDSFNPIDGQATMDDSQPVTTHGSLNSRQSPNKDVSYQQRMFDNEESMNHQNNTRLNVTIGSDWTNQVDWSAIWPYFTTGGLEWLSTNHLYFQLANSFLFLSYLAPAGLYGLIYLRFTLAIGSAFLSLWGWVIIRAFDTFLWNAFFFFINAIHAVILLFSLRPMAFDDHVEQVYKTIFQPLKMSKQEFKKVIRCVLSIQLLKRGEYFAVGQETSIETLSLLLSGTVLVLDKRRTLYAVSPMQFLDSPEWFDSSSSGIFQVSIQSCEESRVLLWHRDKLQSIFQKDAFMQSVFQQILGQDVTKKLTEASRSTKIVKSKFYSEAESNNNAL